MVQIGVWDFIYLVFLIHLCFLAFLGYLYGAVTFLTSSCSSRVSFFGSCDLKEGDKTTKAFTTYKGKMDKNAALVKPEQPKK